MITSGAKDQEKHQDAGRQMGRINMFTPKETVRSNGGTTVLFPQSHLDDGGTKYI